MTLLGAALGRLVPRGSGRTRSSTLCQRSIRRHAARARAAHRCGARRGVGRSRRRRWRREPLPTVASINLCADQHVLALADPEQILTVSWLAADPEESLLAAEAQRLYPELRHGRGAARSSLPTSCWPARTRALSRARCCGAWATASSSSSPKTSVADIERNVRLVAEARRPSRARRAARSRRCARTCARSKRTGPRSSLAAVIVRPGGFTVGADSLADELLDARRALATSPPSAGSTAGAACRWRRCCAARPSSSC